MRKILFIMNNHHLFEKTQDIESHVNVIRIKSKVNFRPIVNVPIREILYTKIVCNFTISIPDYCNDKVKNLY